MVMDRTLARLLHFLSERSFERLRDRLYALKEFLMGKMLGELAGYVKEFKSSLSEDEYQALIKFFMDFEDVVKEDLEELLNDVKALLKRLDKITGFKR